LSESIWIVGAVRSGKTARLVEFARQICDRLSYPDRLPSRLRTAANTRTLLVFAANGDNRLDLDDRLRDLAPQRFRTTTPTGFFRDEVILFWPLLVEKLHLRAQFPIQLRPETEQELATQLWGDRIETGKLHQEGVTDYRMVRRILDLLQLAGAAGVPSEDIATILTQGLAAEFADLWHSMAEAATQWRDWCLERGLLTYGIIFELYWRYLLPDETYRKYLRDRVAGAIADDTDEYPAIAASLFQFFLVAGDVPCAFTYNPDGAVRSGLNADPDAMTELQSFCRTEILPPAAIGLATDWGEAVVQLVADPMTFGQLPAEISSIQTVSRSQLLRQTGETIAEAVRSQQVNPADIAIIAPGVDPVSRYALSEILTRRGIALTCPHDQHPLVSSPDIRALLVFLALVYPGLGRSIDRDAVAEMLVVLSSKRDREGAPFAPTIDPVRAGLLADRCYAPHPESPELRSPTEYDRWDRLGYRATDAYYKICEWIEQTRSQLQQRAIPSFVVVLDRAIQTFLWPQSTLEFDRLSRLRQLMETAQHYWEVASRVRREKPAETEIVGQFIDLLRRGTVAANPYPLRPAGAAREAVTLSNIYQYRVMRSHHRWQFWLDASSHFWFSGGASVLFAAPLFQKSWSGRTYTADDSLQADEERLRRILLDLLARADEKVILCHSDLAINGQEQMGPLLALTNASVPLTGEVLVT